MKKYLVLVLARNEENTIRSCLSSIVDQTIQPSKVIVYDDGSTDRTRGILEEFDREPFQIIYNEMEAPHSYARAFLAARDYIDNQYDYVAILDADTMISEDYYEVLINELKSWTPFSGFGYGFLSGFLINEPQVPFIPGLAPYPAGSNRLFTWEAWMITNKGLKHPLLGVDAYLYFKALAYGYYPMVTKKTKATSLRPRPKKIRDPFTHGYRCYYWGYSFIHMLGRSLLRRELEYIRGYWKARSLGKPRLLDHPKLEHPFEDAAKCLEVFHYAF